ncbi:hypothetical protein SAMN05216490_2215 [Mucilaginibacter mallensis]|uniref:DUF4145 domain-containing protein n=1 Tax=Mucilaginibacter mallensis TaxID=652787 RepID=A0A1H1WN60_MUCMA|nr:hypothetical protein [Mucilaginibacter mallensis]SDS97599.1 hypothetical protein SAMN05216490_2215 [Mucilaginibacter mallensis]
MQQEEILARVDALIFQGRTAIDSQYRNSIGTNYVDKGKFFGFRAAALSFIARQLGKDDSYYIEFNTVCEDHLKTHNEAGVNILLALRNDVENGWLFSLKQLVTAELFSDFLEMSQHLLDEGYKDAAAVMIGSVLEEHLRQLCKTNGIDTYQVKGMDRVPKKANVINDELRRASVYEIIDNRQVTAWLDIRNSAAHGKYSDYFPEQVKLMHLGVLNFISRYK